MPARRTARHADPVRIEIELLRMAANPADRRLAIIRLLRPMRFVGQTIPDSHRRIVARARKLDRRHAIADAITVNPTAAVNVSHDRQRLVAVALPREIDIDHLLRVRVVRIRLIEPQFHAAFLRGLDDFLFLVGEVLGE